MSEFDTNRNPVLQGNIVPDLFKRIYYKRESKVYIDFSFII